MGKLTYKQAFDKITEAYIKDEIQPFRNEFCFCGTLADGSAGWRHRNINGYSVLEFVKMEDALLNTISANTGGGPSWFRALICTSDMVEHSNYEDAIFLGMCAALEVLKQIHIERGEIIDETPTFTKRQLA